MSEQHTEPGGCEAERRSAEELAARYDRAYKRALREAREALDNAERAPAEGGNRRARFVLRAQTALADALYYDDLSVAQV